MTGAEWSGRSSRVRPLSRRCFSTTSRGPKGWLSTRVMSSPGVVSDAQAELVGNARIVARGGGDGTPLAHGGAGGGVEVVIVGRAGDGRVRRVGAGAHVVG